VPREHGDPNAISKQRHTRKADEPDLKEVAEPLAGSDESDRDHE